MNADTLRLIASIVEFVLSACVWLYAWISARNRVTQEAMQRTEQDLRTKIQAQDIEITRLKGQMHALPTQIQMGLLSGKVSEIDGDMKAVKTELRGLNEKFENFTASVQRIEDYLMQKNL